VSSPIKIQAHCLSRSRMSERGCCNGNHRPTVCMFYHDTSSAGG
jgi:hypothetical protein